MSIAICINCGKNKFGALTKCECGFRAVTAVEFCLSNLLTDRIGLDELKSVSLLILKSNSAKSWGPTFENSLVPEQLAFYMNDTGYRRLLQLQNRARPGWFKKEIDYFGIGPDGLVQEALLVGRDLSKTTYSAALQTGEKALYGIETFEKGEKQITLVNEKMWFLAYDKQVILDRQIDDCGYYVQAVNAWYGLLIDKYLEFGRLD